jgi:hypothetical protein
MNLYERVSDGFWVLARREVCRQNGSAEKTRQTKRAETGGLVGKRAGKSARQRPWREREEGPTSNMKGQKGISGVALTLNQMEKLLRGRNLRGC